MKYNASDFLDSLKIETEKEVIKEGVGRDLDIELSDNTKHRLKKYPKVVEIVKAFKMERPSEFVFIKYFAGGTGLMRISLKTGKPKFDVFMNGDAIIKSADLI